jgi:exodeoxyribonuclease VII large subunit
MLEDGLGNLYVAFEKLKKQLSEEGLFNDSHKKAIPKIPSKIGVITSPTGAAIKDIISTIKRRYPVCEILIFPALVQGDNAAYDIVKKIKQADTYNLDTLIVGRGGGSIEDLWPFNEEIVARAIYDAKTPIISAVGHETDFTIADFVSDMRAPTPTGAAEMAVPNIKDIIINIDNLKIRLNEAINGKINYQRLVIDSIKNSFVIKNPLILYDQKKQKLDIILEKLNTYLMNSLTSYQHRLDICKNSYIINNPENLFKDKTKELKTIIDKIELLNPLGVLKRGYSLTYCNKKIIKSIKDVKANDLIEIKLQDGVISAVVEGE